MALFRLVAIRRIYENIIPTFHFCHTVAIWIHPFAGFLVSAVWGFLNARFALNPYLLYKNDTPHPLVTTPDLLDSNPHPSSRSWGIPSVKRPKSHISLGASPSSSYLRWRYELPELKRAEWTPMNFHGRTVCRATSSLYCASRLNVGPPASGRPGGTEISCSMSASVIMRSSNWAALSTPNPK